MDDFNTCVSEHQSELVDEAFKAAVRVCKKCKDMKSNFVSCEKQESNEYENEDCKTHSKIIKLGGDVSIDKEAYKKCR